MLFTSSLFILLFLPVFLAVYHLVPVGIHGKNLIALTSSLLFFSWGEPVFMVALVLFTLIDYKVSLLITPNGPLGSKAKKRLLSFAISFDVLVLILSKYLTFFALEFDYFMNDGASVRNIPQFPLILGISFITFHRISYLVDSYKGRTDPPRSFVDCALYIFLFPQLIAGPIIRYQDIGGQIRMRSTDSSSFLCGFLRFFIGLAKKLVIADPMGSLADRIFGLSPNGLPVEFAWGGALAYMLQIYFDFSAYSDMAIGLAKMMGFNFPENFNRPYISASITEFWRRWHISLTTWMRLYLYIPLGGNRGSNLRTYFNLWLVFLISGLWHGASWNFLAWGAYFGFFLCIERLFSSNGLVADCVPYFLRLIYVLLIVIFGWVLFRSPTLPHALAFFSAMVSFNNVVPHIHVPWGTLFGRRDLVTMAFALALACTPMPLNVPAAVRMIQDIWFGRMNAPAPAVTTLQFALCVFLILFCGAALVSSDYVPFLYFRF